MASAGPYASLHLAPDKQPRQHHITQFFTGRMPFLPPPPANIVKALKARKGRVIGEGAASPLPTSNGFWEALYKLPNGVRADSQPSAP